MSNAVIHIDGPFTSETAKIAGRRSGEVRRAMRRMTEAEVIARIGDLETPEDARRQLAALNILGLAGRVSGAAQMAAVRAVEVFLRHYYDDRGRIIQQLQEENYRLRDELRKALK